MWRPRRRASRRRRRTRARGDAVYPRLRPFSHCTQMAAARAQSLQPTGAHILLRVSMSPLLSLFTQWRAGRQRKQADRQARTHIHAQCTHQHKATGTHIMRTACSAARRTPRLACTRRSSFPFAHAGAMRGQRTRLAQRFGERRGGHGARARECGRDGTVQRGFRLGRGQANAGGR